jgi:antitoxin FitA
MPHEQQPKPGRVPKSGMMASCWKVTSSLHATQALALVHTNAYSRAMSLVQVRGVPHSTVEALKARAAELGLTLTAFLRAEFNRLATQPSNAEIVARMARRSRRGGPTVADTVDEINKIRDAA